MGLGAAHLSVHLNVTSAAEDLHLANRAFTQAGRVMAPAEDPDLLLIGQPTRGVDIGAIEFIHEQIVALRDQGKAILLVSVELDEIFSLSDRIAVMFDGQIMGERLPDETDQTELGLLMAGVTEMPGGDPIQAIDASLEDKEAREAEQHD